MEENAISAYTDNYILELMEQRLDLDKMVFGTPVVYGELSADNPEEVDMMYIKEW